MADQRDLIVVGGGLAGTEAAWQAAEKGLQVVIYEMRPQITTGAHVSAELAELVCSNSLGSNLRDRAAGLLKEELRRMGSLLIKIADRTAVPAGGTLAVDRHAFSKEVTLAIGDHPRIEIIRQEMPVIPDGLCVIASGPLTSSRLSEAIADLSGQEHLFFYDAISPIVANETIDMEIAYRANRYGRGSNQAGDYINCPFNQEQYEHFVSELTHAERIGLKDFENVLKDGVKAGIHQFFESCLPVEIIAERGPKSLAFGPMRPVGLADPKTGRRPYAVVQLRQDNLAGSLYNLVGFQTNLKFPEQRRVFRMIPGLERAHFERYGQMHRNTFIFSPKLLKPTLQFHSRNNLFFAGQITGVEGYAGNIGTGLLAGINAARTMRGDGPIRLPPTTMLGALCEYITHADPVDFQPMKANFGVMPVLKDGIRRNRRERAQAYADRALGDLDSVLFDSQLKPVS